MFVDEKRCRATSIDELQELKRQAQQYRRSSIGDRRRRRHVRSLREHSLVGSLSTTRCVHSEVRSVRSRERIHRVSTTVGRNSGRLLAHHRAISNDVHRHVDANRRTKSTQSNAKHRQTNVCFAVREGRTLVVDQRKRIALIGAWAIEEEPLRRRPASFIAG
jgi:hypothetical protein